MINHFILVLFLISTFAFSQQCNPTVTATEIFYPNTISTTTNSGFKYLCGPNTVLYDTVNTGCKYFYVNAGSTLIFKDDPACLLISRIWLKNNSTLNIQQSSAQVEVNHEPLATIINTVGAIIGLNMCTSITFPTVNCTTSGIRELTFSNNNVSIWPNPATTKINFVLLDPRELFVDIIIKNLLGHTVSEFDQFPIHNKVIPIDNFINGTYLITFQTKSFRQIKKLIVLN